MAHFEAGIVVVSELEVALTICFNWLVTGVEDENVARHILTSSEAAKNDDLRIVERGTEHSFSRIKNIILYIDRCPILSELLSGILCNL